MERRKRRKSSGRLQYNNNEEPHLQYHRGEQKRYEAALASAVLPQSNRSLLRQLTEFMRFIEDLTETVLRQVQYNSEEEDEEDDGSFYARLVQEAQAKLARAASDTVDAPAVNSAAMLEVAWRWHNEICVRGRREPLTGLYAHCFMMSWAAFCKLFFLVVYQNEELYRLIRSHRAEQYAYCARVSAEENVVVSDARLCDYTVQELWLSLQQIVPSLYRHPFEPHMKTYLYALFFRYCDLQCMEQAAPRRCLDNPLFVKFTRRVESGSSSDEEDDDDDADTGQTSSSDDEEAGEEEESEEEDDDDDDDEEEEDYEAYKKQLVPLGPDYALRSAYFFEGQLAFLSQLKRVLFSETLASLCEQAPLRLAEAPPDCTAPVTQMLDALFRDKYLKQHIKEEFRRRVLSLYVYHGETERFRARWPHASHGAGDVLALLRPGDNETAMKVLKLTASEMLAEPQRYERELVLMAKCATRQWLDMKVGQPVGNETLVERLDACFLLEELVTLDTIDERIAEMLQPQPEGPPLLLRLVKRYYVARRSTGQLYQTASFSEAYLLWMKLLLLDRYLRSSHMHADVKSCLRHFKVLAPEEA